MFPNAYTSEKDVEEIINKRISLVYNVPPIEKYSINDKLNSDSDFYEAFSGSISELNSYNICTFDEIGMADPFPNE